MSQESIPVAHYGIHRDPSGIAFLEQGRGSTNAVGLSRRTPFVVRLPNGRKHCNHMIPLSTPVPDQTHWEFFNHLVDDDLAQAMLPLPKRDSGIFFVEESDPVHTIVVMLSKMSSPIYPIVVPIWTVTPQAIANELLTTNVQPYVLYGVSAKHTKLIADLAKICLTAPRTLVLMGASDVVLPSNVRRIKTRLTSTQYSLSNMMVLPWESLGAHVVRKYMRNEWTTSNAEPSETIRSTT